LKGVRATLKGHGDKVNVVRFLPGQPANDEIILSGSVDKTICVWRCSADGFSLAKKLEGIHHGSLNSIATCLHYPSVFVSGSADGTVAIFSLTVSPDNLEIKHLQSISTKPKFLPLSLAISTIPTSKDAVILAVAGSANSISVYTSTSPTTGTEFTLQASLSGHENWVRSLNFINEDPGSWYSDLILASASQDKYIRLWRLHPGANLPPAAINSGSKTYGLSTCLSNKAHMIRFPSSTQVWSLTFEALLMGHEDWIYTACWNPNAKSSKELQLLSCSADNSLSIWAPEESSGIWVPVHRFGEMSDLKGASTATGSAGGMWNCLWSPDGNAVTALTKNGSWRVWRYNSIDDRWCPAVGISGHTKDVTSISWAPDGCYLLTTSLDQTSRLFAHWTAGGSDSWQEFSRPQIHGYDINCISSVGPNRFVSGADEKLLRVFDEPKAIANALETFCGIQPGHSTDTLPNAANLPVLGLSNKPIDTSAATPMQDGHEPDTGLEDEDGGLEVEKNTVEDLSEDTPPMENQLSRHTLWPEIEKLYGHGYEISALAAAPNSSLIATACKASTLEHAVIRLYDGDNNWREVKPQLQSHSLTVTNLRFSPSGDKLVSVGRDRAWSVFGRDISGKWALLERRDKAHTRIIYDCAWMPVTESGGKTFLTVSRDKNLKIWEQIVGDSDTVTWSCKATVKFPLPITAVDVLGEVVTGRCWILTGLENGALELYTAETGKWETMAKKLDLIARYVFLALGVEGLWQTDRDNSITPDKAITEITWRPGTHSLEAVEVAVASEDGSVRIYGIFLEELVD
jgi:elongator complex protein 2